MTNNICLLFVESDSDKASQIQNALKALSIDVWSPQSIAAGGLFIKEMKEALNKARFIIILCSSNFLNNALLRKLAEREKQKGKVLIPILIENVSKPLEFLDNKEVDLIGWNGENDKKFVELWNRIDREVKLNNKGIDWNINIIIGILGVIIALVSVVVGITNPEVRCFLKLQCTPSKISSPSTSETISLLPVEAASSSTNVSREIFAETLGYIKNSKRIAVDGLTTDEADKEMKGHREWVIKENPPVSEVKDYILRYLKEAREKIAKSKTNQSCEALGYMRNGMQILLKGTTESRKEYVDSCKGRQAKNEWNEVIKAMDSEIVEPIKKKLVSSK